MVKGLGGGGEGDHKAVERKFLPVDRSVIKHHGRFFFKGVQYTATCQLEVRYGSIYEVCRVHRWFGISVRLRVWVFFRHDRSWNRIIRVRVLVRMGVALLPQ